MECNVPTLALHGSKESWNRHQSEDVLNAGDSSGNYHLMDEESTGARGFHRE
jgi:hypothetical protein